MEKEERISVCWWLGCLRGLDLTKYLFFDFGIEDLVGPLFCGVEFTVFDCDLGQARYEPLAGFLVEIWQIVRYPRIGVLLIRAICELIRPVHAAIRSVGSTNVSSFPRSESSLSGASLKIALISVSRTAPEF